MKRLNLWLSGVSVAVLMASAGAQTWDETTNGGGDAGDLPSTAQVVSGAVGQPLTSVTGALSAGSDVDMYQIIIKDPARFRAWTVSSVDTQLWLFDANGKALWHNDDAPSGITPPLSPAPGSLNSFIGYGAPTTSYYLSNATNTSAGSAGSASWPGILTSPGLYYIAVSAYNRDPRDSGGGNVIYSGSPFSGIHQSNPADTDRVVASWTGSGFSSGAYTIYFEQANFVPEPASMLALGVGLAGLLGLRRRVKK